jgi:hypothetical protein
MNLDNLAEKYKEMREKLRQDFTAQVEYLIDLGEKIIGIEKNINILSDRAEKRLALLESKILRLKKDMDSLTQDVRSNEDRIRDIE